MHSSDFLFVINAAWLKRHDTKIEKHRKEKANGVNDRR